MTVFVDTSALYAVMDRDDRFHPEARKAWVELLETGQGLLTSNYVLVETTALIQSRLGLKGLRSWLNDIQPVLSVAWVTEEDHAAAAAAVLAAQRRGLSLVDCVSFQIMRRQATDTAFAFDPHFSQYGFHLIPSSAR